MMLDVKSFQLQSFLPLPYEEVLAPRLKRAHEKLQSGSGAGGEFTGWVHLPRDYDREEKINEWEKRMIFGSRKVNELYQRYCRQVLKILRSPSYDLTGEECREIWDEIWKEAMRRKRELRKLKSEEERQSWILAVVKRKLEERKSKDKSHRL